MAERERRTFRVRQIPAYLKHRDLPRLLHKFLSYHGTLDQITVYSLAPSIESYERPPTLVATVGFRICPSALVEGEDEWVLPKEETFLQHNIIIDTHFLGFTVLNNVAEKEHETE